jgi:hypothetical protein
MCPLRFFSKLTAFRSKFAVPKFFKIASRDSRNSRFFTGLAERSAAKAARGSTSDRSTDIANPVTYFDTLNPFAPVLPMASP